MNWDLFKILALVGAYVLGSIPTSVWFGKVFYNIDLRDHGSGNAGATNALRVFGNKAGALVLFIDALKGASAVSIGYFFIGSFTRENYQVIFMLSLGASALLGHVFPLFAQFRGGKGIATLAGIGIAMFPWAVLICLGVFILVFIPTRYVSLGSITAALSFPIILIVLKCNLISEIVFGFGVAIFVLLTHQKNIKRLLKGQENKLHFKKKGIANS
jgi:acyl phosphate:glycerol-3-phosphate acyltransferase